MPELTSIVINRVEPHIEHEHGGRQWMFRQPRATSTEIFAVMSAETTKAIMAAKGVVIGVAPVFPEVYYNPDPYCSGFQKHRIRIHTSTLLVSIRQSPAVQ